MESCSGAFGPWSTEITGAIVCAWQNNVNRQKKNAKQAETRKRERSRKIFITGKRSAENLRHNSPTAEPPAPSITFLVVNFGFLCDLRGSSLATFAVQKLLPKEHEERHPISAEKATLNTNNSGATVCLASDFGFLCDLRGSSFATFAVQSFLLQSKAKAFKRKERLPALSGGRA